MERALSFMSSYFISLLRLKKGLIEIRFFFKRIKLILDIGTSQLYLKLKARKFLSGVN